MSRLTSLSSTSRILCIGLFQSKIGRRRDERRGSEDISLPPPGEQRHPDREAAAFSDFAFDGNLAAHQLAELLAERQSQPSAAVFAGAGVVGDSKFLEEVRDLIRSDTNAGVDDMDHKIIAWSIQAALGDKLDLAVVSKLYRVIKQLAGHIAEFAGITVGRSEIGSDRADDLVSAIRGRRSRCVDNLAEQFGQISFFQVQFHFSRLDLRQVEYLVNELEEVLAGTVNFV